MTTLSAGQTKWLVVGLCLIACLAIMLLGPIPQDPSYHRFVDDRPFLGIPNFQNVVSNIGFLVVGLYGFAKLGRMRLVTRLPAYVVFLVGVTAVAFGSSYYHLFPDNHSLLWDRLPMTIAFMALVSIVFAEFVSLGWARRSLWPLLLLGVSSCLYWYVGELSSQGDLRLYALVQYLSMAVVLLMLAVRQSAFSHVGGYWTVFSLYVLAKVFEVADAPTYWLTRGLVGGHAIKHWLAALGLYFLIRSYERRRLVNTPRD